MASDTSAKPVSTPPMLDAEGNVSVVASDGTSYTLRAPLGEDMEKVENTLGNSTSKVRAMCAAIAILSLEPLTVDTVLSWRFDKIVEVGAGLQVFPSLAANL